MTKRRNDIEKIIIIKRKQTLKQQLIDSIVSMLLFFTWLMIMWLIWCDILNETIR